MKALFSGAKLATDVSMRDIKRGSRCESNSLIVIYEKVFEAKPAVAEVLIRWRSSTRGKIGTKIIAKEKKSLPFPNERRRKWTFTSVKVM